MREIKLSTKNFSRRDIINSRAGKPLQDFDGSKKIEHVTAAAIAKDTDEETGEIRDVGIIKTADAEYYTTISATVLDSMDAVVEIIDDEGEIDLRIDKRKSNGGRDFLTLIVL